MIPWGSLTLILLVVAGFVLWAAELQLLAIWIWIMAAVFVVLWKLFPGRW